MPPTAKARRILGLWRGAYSQRSATEEQQSQQPRPAARSPGIFSKHALTAGFRARFMVKLMVDEYVTRSGYHLQVHTEAECGGPEGSQAHPPSGTRTLGRRRFADRGVPHRHQLAGAERLGRKGEAFAEAQAASPTRTGLTCVWPSSKREPNSSSGPSSDHSKLAA